MNEPPQFLIEQFIVSGKGYEVIGSCYASTFEEAKKIAEDYEYYIIWNLCNVKMIGDDYVK